jgi:diaminopimelate epimerase
VTVVAFTKMQGLGNDFIVVEGPLQVTDEEVARLCDRRFGIGADGILVVTRNDPPWMEYWNADGSAAEMCGNGLRCVARYVYDRAWVRDRNFSIGTALGVRGARVLEEGVEVDLGPVEVVGSRVIDGVEYLIVDVGNPHAVAFVDDPDRVDLGGVGRSVQREFPEGINVEFAADSGSFLRMRVWERGVGETLACGTGMVAVVAASESTGGKSGPVEVRAPGGAAVVEIRGGRAWLKGPAEYSFSGSVAGR